MAAKIVCAGPDCSVRFAPKTARAKYHADKCRKAAARARSVAPTPDESLVDAAGDGADHEPTAESVYGRNILDAVRRDLEKVGQLDTVDGRIALYLARKSIDPDAKNTASLLKEMRAALDAAIAKGQPEQPTPTEPAADEDDEVTRARNARKEAREAAGLS